MSWHQIQGLVMDTLTSATLAKTYIQLIEHKYIQFYQTTGDFRYNVCRRYCHNLQPQPNIDETLAEFNNLI
jgi:hypothetical protein